MLSAEYKKKAMEALQNMSAEELVSILTEIGSVQMSESISVDIPSTSQSSCVAPWIEQNEITEINQEIPITVPTQYRFDLPAIEMPSTGGKAA